jgi:hypothetical protein
MATKNEYFNPWMEAIRAMGQNTGNFLMHPTQQSMLAAQVAQQLAQNQADAMRPSSPLQPYSRPGVAQDSPDALTPEQMQLMRQKGLLSQ